MGRRRWRFIAVAAFLFVISRETSCQDENDFYYTPVERRFAQVQPPLFPNNRPDTYFDHGDNYRLVHSNLPNTDQQQQLFNEAHTRFPSPNYNQHPSPFQLPSGRSQASGQFYLNQPDFTSSQRQRFRPSFPHSFHLIHPASTKRPDISQIHSIAYQNDPSKPETFLGQITLNNPDTDFLQNGRFKNMPFDGNSLKTNQQNHGVPNDDDVDTDNQDLFEPKVTTYNPNKIQGKPKINIKSNIGHISHSNSGPLEDESNQNTNKYYNSPINNNNTPNKLFSKNDFKSTTLLINAQNQNTHYTTSTEYKALLDLEPLLEDDISDITSFRELMKNTHGSFDVEVIKSGDKDANAKHEYDKYDSNPSASSMNTDNVSKEMPINSSLLLNKKEDKNLLINNTLDYKSDINKEPNNTSNANSDSVELEYTEKPEDEIEYDDYYDEPVTTEVSHSISNVNHSEHSEEIYDDYESTEHIDSSHEEIPINASKTFDVLPMKTNKTTVKEDNFKQFVDTTAIDETEHPMENNNKLLMDTNITLSAEDLSSEVSSADIPSILGQEIVSVVTTKSVVNGTISIPDVTYAPTTTRISMTTEIPLLNDTLTFNKTMSSTSIPNTTENWIVVASVQTSRSVSGARFLPFPTVEQDEKKQVLSEADDAIETDEEIVTKNPKSDDLLNQQVTMSSTENINDKLDSIQSELSSAVLAGTIGSDDENIAHITESTTENEMTDASSITPSTLNVFTLKSTLPTVVTEKSSPEPLPVLIKKFTPRITSSTTQKPRKKLVTVMDDLTGFLPPGFKHRPSFKDKKTSTTTTTTPTSILSEDNDDNINENQGRSSGITSKNKVILLDRKSSLVPKDYQPPSETKIRDDLFKKLNKDDLSKFLPPGFILPQNNTTPKSMTIPDILEKVQKIDIKTLLPKDYNKETITEKVSIGSKLLTNAAPVDITAFLPPNFKLNTTNEKPKDSILNKFKVSDISSLLPPGFKLNTSEESLSISLSTTKAPSSHGFKIVFPSRPGVKPVRKTTTQKPNIGSGPDAVTPVIHKGWPTRVSTEFTGWPSPSTTPFSIEKLLEAQRNATATSPLPDLKTEATTRRTTSTSTTTPTPQQPTTPGICRKECDIAATIKIVAGVKWVPELLDHHTDEWQNLANEVKDELNSVYSKSDILKKWYKGIRIDAFSQGSVLVDYFVELNDVEERVDTQELKKLFHRSLSQAKPESVIETISEELNDEIIDPDIMLGDQPDVDRMTKSNEKMTKTIDKSAGKLEIGKFVMDPAYTEFIVLPKREEPTIVEPEEESFLPQWGIAVIVIALASLLFVVIFGVTVLVNRQKSAKAKQPIPLSEDMLRELDKSHMGGFDDGHQMKERDLPYLPSGKRMSTAFIEQLAYPNPGDSWRSEWTPQIQKYMQHYTPDSGRGSQIYGTGGNVYGYSGSQLYGQTGGGGSQIYGYTGEYPRSHFSRRRSDYDSNF